MAGYVRQSSAEIVDTLTIDAVDLNNEFDALVSAFVNTTGHKHDGTAANGPVIGLIGDANLATPLNKILTDTANAELEFYINVGAVATEQFKVSDGLIVPSVNNDIDLGTTALKFKDAFFDGTVTLDGLVVSGSTAITSIDTDLTTVSANDDTLASAKAIKAAIAAIPEGDLTSIVAGSGLTGTDLSGPIPTLNVISGNGLTANADNIVIDTSITVDKTTAQTLSLKTLTSPVLNGTLSGTAFLDEDTLSSDSAIAVASQQSIKAYIDNNVSSVTPSSTTTFTNKTIDANGTGNSISNLEVADLASGVLDTDLTAVAATDTTLASAKAIKTYVDSQEHSVTPSSVTTFTNKTIDVDATGNSITNLANANIKAAAAIDASKIADGSVSDAEFQRLDGLTSDIQTQLDLKAALASPALTGNPTAPTQVAGNNSTRLATTAYVDNSTASRDQLGELTDVTLASEADANYFIYDNAASVWKNKAISGAFTSTNLGVTTLASGIDATKIADGTVTDSEFQFINSLSSNAQDQIDTKQATIDSSNRLNANLVGDGSVDNTEFGYLNGVTSDIQAQISAKASAGFAVAMAIAL